jgi:threonine aldolase
MVQIQPNGLPLLLEEWRESLAKEGIKINPAFGGILRLVTHRDVNRDDVDRLIRSLD